MKKKSYTGAATLALSAGAGAVASRVVNKLNPNKDKEDGTGGALINDKTLSVGKVVLGAVITAMSKDKNIQAFGLGMAGNAAVEAVNHFTNDSLGLGSVRYPYRTNSAFRPNQYLGARMPYPNRRPIAPPISGYRRNNAANII